jgi:hypothetical protein
VRDPELDRHEWETEWQGLEPLVADSPAEALPELDELARRMLGHGYPVDEEHEFAAPEAEVVKEFLEACRVTRRVDAGESVDPGDVGAAVAGYRNVDDYLTSSTSPSDRVRRPSCRGSGEGSPGLLPKAIVVRGDARVCYGGAPIV